MINADPNHLRSSLPAARVNAEIHPQREAQQLAQSK